MIYSKKYWRAIYCVMTVLLMLLFSTGIAYSNVIVYSDDNYTGDKMELDQGLHYKPEISDGVGNDKISSLSIPSSSNLEVILFVHDDFTGTYHAYDSSQNSLPSDINNKTSSLIVQEASPSCTLQATIYSAVNYGGSSVSLGIGYHYYDSIDDLIIASIKIPAGLRVTLFSEKNFTGDAVTFIADTTSVGKLYGKTKSMIIEENSIPAGEVAFYTMTQYTGKRICLPDGVYPYKAIRDTIGNDQISSLKNPSGKRVTLFDKKDFSGDDQTFFNNSSDVGNMDDKTSSVLIESFSSTPTTPTFYEHTSYKGKSMALGFWLYDKDVVNRIGNDKISSLKVPSGFKVTLYENDDFKGDSIDYQSDSNNLGADWNDKTSSIIVEPAPSITSQAQFFPQDNFQGTPADFGVGRYDKPWLERTVGNDKICSVKVPSGLKVTLFEKDGFSGKIQVCDRDTESLNKDLKGKASSLVVEIKDSSGLETTLYEDENYSGKKISLGIGRYNRSTLDNTVGNDKISSLQIPAGLKVTLYENDNFTRKMKTFYEDSSFIEKFMDNKTTSLIVEAHTDSGAQTFILIADPQFTNNKYNMDDLDIKFQRFTEALDQLSGLNWPTTVSHTTTDLELAGQKIEPQYIVFAGDLVNWPANDKENKFRKYFDFKDNPGTAVHLYGYIGLGNHDFAGHNDGLVGDIKKQNTNSDAPLRPYSFDKNSQTYAWYKNDVLFMQCHRFGGDNLNKNRGGEFGGLDPSQRTTFEYADNCLPWIQAILDTIPTPILPHPPLVLIQHYNWATTPTYWSVKEEDDLDAVLSGHRVVRLHGHLHYFRYYDWNGDPVISAAAASPQWGAAESYCYLVRAKGTRLEVVECVLSVSTEATPVTITFNRVLIFDLTTTPVSVIQRING